ncbi:MAG: hypothetical protein RMJ28_03275 [Nitrososphaerota archaeon]|nr:hypothetical protein [Candidatus Calditenuaceae archaeon]MDW8073242.1 hypothetical protein [Nitrososphaerota archaeon]
MDRTLSAALMVSISYFTLLALPGIMLYGPLPPPRFLETIVSTATHSTLSTLLVIPTSLILGYTLTFRTEARYLTTLILSTTAIPHTAIGVLLSPIIFNLQLTDTSAAIILGMFIVSTPIGVGVLRASFAAQGVEMEEYLRGMGVRGFRILWFYLRASPTSVLLAALLSWFRAFSELGVFLIIAQRPQTVGIYIFEEFLKTGPTAVISASLILLGVALVLTLATVVLEGGPRSS